MKDKRFPRLFTSVISLALLTSSLVVRPSLALAFVESGQLAFARQVTINGNNALSGQTVFSGNKLKVGGNGTAIVNLGKQGRMELGANSEMALFIAPENIGGTLMSGCMLVKASAGETVRINTPKGEISSVGSQSTSFFIGLKGNSINVYPNAGEIRVTTNGKTEVAKYGELLSLTTDPKGAANLKLLPKGACGETPALCACNATSVPKATGNGASSNAKPPATVQNGLSPGVIALIFGATGATAAAMFGLTGGGSGLTCVNNSGPFCNPLSPTVP